LAKVKIRWGIIGCGDVTEVKSGPGFQKAEGSELVAVMRRNKHLAKDYAERHNVPKWYGDAQDLINDPDVDAVYIATPPSSHKKYVFDVANAGKPVYVEKPMALSYKECLEMVEFCEQRNVPLFAAYYRRALPRFIKIKSLIEEKTMGEVRCVNVRLRQKPSEKDLLQLENWRTNPSIAGCGYFCDMASHTIDILQFILGEIKETKGFSGNQQKLYEAEDIVSASFIFESGIQGTGSWCFSSNNEVDETEIVGSEGRIIFPTFQLIPTILETKNSKEEFDIKNPPHIAQLLIQTIVDELRGVGRCPSTGRTGASASRVMDKILGRE
jgi:predicted dehydrogenase